MIYINGRFLTQDLTGVQRFAEEISINLQFIRDDIIFLVPDIKSIKRNVIAENINVQEAKGFKGHLWEQITLPHFLLKRGRPLLVNLCNTAPVMYSNQIVTHHDITYIKYPKSFPLSFRLLYRLLSPLMLRNSRKVITVSNFSKKEISQHYSCPLDKINVIYNAASSNFKEEKITNFELSDDYILAVSSTNYHKNFQGLIDEFLATNLDIKLKIIGGTAGVFNRINLENKDSRVQFIGRVDDAELIKLYQQAKAFVFPSLYEGFGIPPLEAQACGCPVISSNKASMPEVLEESVLYFDPDLKGDIANKLEKICNEQDCRELLIAKGLENVKRFSWIKSANKLNDLIEGVSN